MTEILSPKEFDTKLANLEFVINCISILIIILPFYVTLILYAKNFMMSFLCITTYWYDSPVLSFIMILFGTKPNVFLLFISAMLEYSILGPLIVLLTPSALKQYPSS